MAGQCFFLVAIYGRAIFFGGNVCLSIMLPQSWAFSPPIASNHNLPRCSKWTLWSQRRENIFDLSHHKSTMHQYHHHHYQFTTITTTPNCTPQVLISMLDSRLVSPFLRRSGGKDLFMLHGVGRFFYHGRRLVDGLPASSTILRQTVFYRKDDLIILSDVP